MSRIGSAKFGAFGDFGSSAPSVTGKGNLGLLNSKPKDALNSKSVPKVEPNDYVPKRFGLRYNPPTIIIEYLVPSSGKLYHHKVKVSNLKADSDTKDTLETLKKKHPIYFGGNKVSDSQIADFIDKLKKKISGSSIGGTFLTSDMFGENKKESNLKVGKAEPLTLSLPNKPNNNLGSFDINKAKAGPTAVNSKTPKDDKKDGGNNFWAFDDLEDLEDDEEKVDYNCTNLNKLSKEELEKHKNKMSVLFNKNQKKPGDSGFVYDKQQEFVPKDENEWDEEF